MIWFLIMWVCVAECAVDEIGVRQRKVEMHLSETGCLWAKQETRLARGYVMSARCEARMRMPEPKYIQPVPLRRRDIAEVRP